MPYFSRLTDIVTCNLSAILAEVDDPRAALTEILREMQEGVAGAQRSMKTSHDHELRIQQEIGEQRAEVLAWDNQARQQLAASQEADARSSLFRKKEVTNLIAGLEQQHRAAIATREQMETMFRALEARQADARRRLTALVGGSAMPVAETLQQTVAYPPQLPASAQIDEELAALKRELTQSAE